jgi:hypothetical protein
MEEQTNEINKHIIGFHLLVKNRLGPYYIVIKKDSASYLNGELNHKSKEYRWSFSKEEAYHYTSKWAPFRNDVIKDGLGRVYLTTAAGDILLTEKDVDLAKDGRIK